MRPLALLLAAALAGCAVAAPPATARLERLDAAHFRFVAPADPHRPLNDPQGEHARRAWLERRLAEATLCPRGYRIDRREARDEAGLVKPVGNRSYDVVYEGSCVE
jgi:hypothetical protein